MPFEKPIISSSFLHEKPGDRSHSKPEVFRGVLVPFGPYKAAVLEVEREAA
jgi:hypothetical protein